MMKKLQLFCLALLSVISLHAQNEAKGRTCATPIPSAEWNAWFNTEVEKFKAQLLNGNARIKTNYTIPVIVHVIHSGGAVGVGDNVSQAQVQDQIAILNADYAGTGTNYTNCPVAFQPILANTNIQWCLAVSDPTGGVLAQPGIDRVAATSIPGVTSVPAGGFTTNFIDQTIKPATIWNPTKYCNVWILQLQNGLLGYATFPAGTTLAGITGGGSATTDGVVVGHNYFGSVGSASASAPYNLGRTASHELGHWLGLRHVWGDGNCLTDYCNDTPWAKQANFGCPTVPAFVNRCGAGQSPNGEMVMNFMDYTDDPCMYMFTIDQRTRMQTAMSQGTYRNLLGTHGLCTLPTPTPAPANAQFVITGTPCIGSPFTPSNTSTGGPAPTFTWMSVPGASFNPNPNVASPAITFTAPGSYTLSLVASNSLATSTYSQVIFNVSTCPKQPVCLDTLSMITALDTLTTYITPTSSFVLACQSGWTGFLTGTNCYKDKSFAQWYAGNTYSDTPNPQVNSMIVLFNQGGTKATATTSATQIYCRVYGGTSNAGPASSLSYVSDSLGKIAALTGTNQVQFAGNPNYIFPGNTVLVHKFNFPAPVIVPTSGFFGAVETPYASIPDSIQIFSDTKTSVTNDSSSWVLLYNNNNWRTLRYQRGAKVQLAIFPQISCRPVVGIEEKSEFKSNITVMPNPSAGLFSLVFTFPIQQKVKIKIYNCIGQVISTDEIENVGSNYFDVDLRTVPDGVYFLEVSNGKEKITKKLIIAK